MSLRANDRYASPKDLAEDLENWLAGEPVRAWPEPWTVKARRWITKHRTLVTAAAVTIVVAMIGLTVGMVVLSTAYDAESLARQEAGQAKNQAEAALVLAAQKAKAEETAKNEADAARRGAQRQLLDLSIASGIAAARQGDHSLALLWFARAVQLAKVDAPQEKLNRIRIANWLREVCVPEGTFTIPGFRAYQDRVLSIRFSPDGQFLLISTSAGSCLVWDRAQSRIVELPLSGVQSRVAAWDPASGRLAVAGNDATICVLAPPDFRLVDKIKASEAINTLAFNRDGKLLAWGGTSGARVWDQKLRAYATPLLPHDAQVVTLSFSAGSDLLATSARDNKARVYRIDATNADPLYPPLEHTFAEDLYFHRGPDFAANDQVLLLVANDRLRWYSALTGKLLSSINSPDDNHLHALAVSADGERVAAVWGIKGRLWDAKTRQVLSTIPTPPPFAWNEDIAFSTDRNTLVTCGRDMKTRFWSVNDRSSDTLMPSYPPIFHSTLVIRARLGADNRHLATALWDGTVCLWRLPTGAPSKYALPNAWGSLPVLTNDQRFLLPRGLSFRNARRLDTRVYEAETGKPAGPTLIPGGILIDAAFSPDARLLATASSTPRTPNERNERLFEPNGKAGNVQLWDWRTGQRRFAPIPTPAEPRSLAFRPDGSTLAVVCADYHVLLIDAKTATIRHAQQPDVRAPRQSPNQWFSNGEALQRRRKVSRYLGDDQRRPCLESGRRSTSSYSAAYGALASCLLPSR